MKSSQFISGITPQQSCFLWLLSVVNSSYFVVTSRKVGLYTSPELCTVHADQISPAISENAPTAFKQLRYLSCYS